MSAIFTENRGIAGFTSAIIDGSLAPPDKASQRHVRWIMIFLAVGVTIRLLRYLLRFPLWGDEAMLAMNFLDRGYGDMMRPLDFHQVAPLLFLWIELAAVKLLGFHEWSLRLFPLLCGIASLFLFHRLAKLLLRGTALLLAVGIFAVTYSGVRYAAETKPYSGDLMVSTLLLWMAVRWWQRPGDSRWLWALAAVVPLALGMSNPAVFIAGGVSLTAAAVLLSTRSWPGWRAWCVYNLVLIASFLGWYKLSVGAQAEAELNVMTLMWEETFPPGNSLLGLLKWLVKTHAGPLLAVPVGGSNWGSIGTLLFCLVAVGVLIHKGRYRLLMLCSAPFALNLIAAAMHRFPYGGHMRLTMHLAPLVCILGGIGATAVFQWLRPRKEIKTDNSPSQPMTWPVATAVFLLLLLGLLTTARDFCLPGKEQQEIRKRDFAAWFWGSMERNHEVVNISADLKQIFTPPGDTWQNCVSPQFLCNARIYSPRQSQGRSPDLGRVSRQRPLECVQYWTHCSPYDQAAFGRWLDEMKQRYDLIATQLYPMLQDNDDDRVPEPPDRVEVYEFVPKESHQIADTVGTNPKR